MLWKNILTAVLALVATFAIAEAILWGAGVQPLMAERDPYAGFSRRVRVFEDDPARGVIQTSSRAVAQSFNAQEFAADKPPDGFRFFVLGGSSAFGFPWGAKVAYAQPLADALAATWPERTIEPVNAAGMSYGSLRLRVLMHEVLAYEPNLIIIDSGHNEFVERQFYRDALARGASVGRLRGLLYRWRLYGLMTRLIARIRKPAPEPAEATTTGELLGLDVAREEARNVRDEERESVRRTFEENLRAIVDLARQRGVSIVLCTVASNLRDWRPNQAVFFESTETAARNNVLSLLGKAVPLLAQGSPVEALGLLEQACTLAPEHAGVNYQLGRAYEALSRWEEARASYERARDLDAQPSRAPAAINETIRQVAAATETLLVDVERDFAAASEHGLTGLDLIEDYVHPTPRGHRLIALSIWKALNRSGLLGEPRDPDEKTFWEAAGPPPGRDAAAHDARAGFLYNMALVLSHQGLTVRAIETYRDCLEIEPRHYVAAYNLGLLLFQQDAYAEAAEQFSAALAVEPRHLGSILGLGMAEAKMGQVDAAAETFREATRVDPGSVEAWNGLGYALEISGKRDEAMAAYEDALLRDPRHVPALTNLGVALVAAGSAARGIPLLRESLALNHAQPRARYALAEALVAAGELDEAESHYRTILERRPDDDRARTGLASIQKLRGQAR